MRARVRRALVALGITLAICVATALPAAAATSGPETVHGVIVALGVSGTCTVITSVAVAKAVRQCVRDLHRLGQSQGAVDREPVSDLNRHQVKRGIPMSNSTRTRAARLVTTPLT